MATKCAVDGQRVTVESVVVYARDLTVALWTRYVKQLSLTSIGNDVFKETIQREQRTVTLPCA